MKDKEKKQSEILINDSPELAIKKNDLEDRLFIGRDFCELVGLNSRDIFFVEKRYPDEEHTFKKWVELLTSQKLDVIITNNLKNSFNL